MADDPQNIREILDELLQRTRGGASVSPRTLTRLKDAISELQQIHTLLGGAEMPDEKEQTEQTKTATAINVAKQLSPLLTLAVSGGAGSALPALVKIATGYDIGLTPENAASLVGLAGGGAHAAVKYGSVAVRSIFKWKPKE
ncbi:MAG: hypothetical protein ABFD89_16980 [Bryobacteraceae bacterium]